MIPADTERERGRKTKGRERGVNGETERKMEIDRETRREGGTREGVRGGQRGRKGNDW